MTNKIETLKTIAELLDLQEQAIQNHPPSLVAVYFKGRAAFIEGQKTSVEDEWSKAMGLKLDELKLMERYMLSSAFISAWYHLAGDKVNRDKAAHSCSILIESLGSDLNVMQRYIKRERLWRQIFKQEGVAPHRFGSITSAIIISGLTLLIAFLFGKPFLIPMSILIASIIDIITRRWVVSDRLGLMTNLSTVLKFICATIGFYVLVGQMICIILILRWFFF